MQFRNPQNGYVESAGGAFSWLWVLIFGPLYWAVKGVWRHFFLQFFLNLFTLGLAVLVYPFFTYAILEKHYLRTGWQPLGGDNDFSEGENVHVKKSGIQPLVIFFSGFMLLSAGFVFSYFWFGSAPSYRSIEIEEIVAEKLADKDVENNTGIAAGAQQASTEDEANLFEIRHYDFPSPFSTNLSEGEKPIQASLRVSTTYDEAVIKNIERHKMALRTEVLKVMSSFSHRDFKDLKTQITIQNAVISALNKKLEKLTAFGGIEEAVFTNIK